MKAKSELLTIYSKYLPHKLNFLSQEIVYLLTELKFIGQYPVWASTAWNSKSLKYEPEINLTKEGLIGRGFRFSKIKPILYSMDMLTQEIEHDGKRFIPIEELAKIHINWNEFDYGLKVEAKVKRQFNLVIKWKIRNRDDDFYSDDLFIMTEKWHLNQYWVVQKLLEWNFNIFKLEDFEFIKKENINSSK